MPPAWPGRRAYRDEVAVLAAALRRRGHAVKLLYFDRSVESDLGATIAAGQPDLLLLYAEALTTDLAVMTAGVAASTCGAPLVAFGPHARLRPDDCLSLVGAEAAAVGPADFSIPEYLASRRNSPDSARTPGMWVKCETGIMRNLPPKPPASLDDQPLPARDLYLSEETLDPAGFAYVGAARGGEDVAAAAPGPPGAGPPMPGAWSPTGGWPVLHRSLDAVLDEMAAVSDAQIDLEGWRIGNERWTASPEWLAGFAARYPKEIALPLRTALYAPDITARTSDLLAQAGCREVAVMVGSGSTFIRNEILGLSMTAESIADAFSTLRGAGIPSVARVQIGAPYETAVTLDETARLLTRLGPDRIEAVLHFPTPGSPSWKIARENGWLVSDPAAAHMSGRPAVAIRSLSEEELIAACELLPYRVHRPRLVPLLRLARRVRIGRYGTAYDLVVKPMLAPPLRRAK
jgi:anaerobic magnesium-protoporphyrin IX monomethyl ester cyclase